MAGSGLAESEARCGGVADLDGEDGGALRALGRHAELLLLEHDHADDLGARGEPLLDGVVRLVLERLAVDAHRAVEAVGQAREQHLEGRVDDGVGGGGDVLDPRGERGVEREALRADGVDGALVVVRELARVVDAVGIR